MNLYFVERLDEDWISLPFEQFDSFVAAAASLEDARKMSPTFTEDDPDNEDSHGRWLCPEDRNEQNVGVRHIGKASEDITRPCVICTSYNAL
jgi:hypothetical protein